MSAVTGLLGAALIGTAVAQTDPGDHGAHHPSQPAGTAAPAPPPASVPAMPSMPGATPALAADAGCGGMMGCMGGPGRPFYASLLDMPALTAEAQRVIEAEAERRIGWGSQAITSGQARLHHALATNDTAAVQQAAAGVREGLLLLESGTAALRAIEAGTAPRQLALTWFRGQLGLPPVEAAPITDGGPWGLSWYHLTSMAFLVAFLVGTLLIQHARMRRVDALVRRLSPAGAALDPAPAPPTAGPATGAADTVPLPTPPASAAPSAAAATAAARRPWSGTLRVAAIFRETPTVKTFRLVEPGGGDVPFTFMPGQFLTVSAELDGKTARRSYTIASSPTQRSHVEVTVKREEQGLISRHLHDRVAVGDAVEVSAPLGVFTFMGEEASIVLIAGGVGITPMMSVARYLTDRSYPCEIFFLYGARRPEEFVFREELEYLQKRHANLYVAATMSRAEGTAWMGATGPISKEFIARSVPEIARRRVHLCGPPPMMEAARAALAELGVPKNQIKTEAFGPARGVAPGTPAPLPPPPPAPSPGPTPAGEAIPRVATAEVRFTKSGKTGALAPDQTVLEAAEAIAVEIEYSCRVGICGACKVRLLEGAVTMEVEEGLPPEEKARGVILACQAKSVGNLSVEA
ncbi:2Fe-2S iron-sulfur cluster-binding protein [Belnapia rosea]|nr:2Fe-2S iron-sulfur cluster-binding protein [Belnapia rosea]